MGADTSCVTSVSGAAKHPDTCSTIFARPAAFSANKIKGFSVSSDVSARSNPPAPDRRRCRGRSPRRTVSRAIPGSPSRRVARVGLRSAAWRRARATSSPQPSSLHRRTQNIEIVWLGLTRDRWMRHLHPPCQRRASRNPAGPLPHRFNAATGIQRRQTGTHRVEVGRGARLLHLLEQLVGGGRLGTLRQGIPDEPFTLG